MGALASATGRRLLLGVRDARGGGLVRVLRLEAGDEDALRAEEGLATDLGRRLVGLLLGREQLALALELFLLGLGVDGLGSAFDAATDSD